jgi:hypothetical protein
MGFTMERVPGWRQPNCRSIPETFSESYREDNGFYSRTLDGFTSGWIPSAAQVLALTYAMTSRFMKQSVALLLVLCLLAVGALASAQSISHESHHAHHHKAAHSTVLCSWMCAAGQVLDTVSAPALVERASISRVELYALSAPASNFSSPLVSRGPPNPPAA